MRSLSDVLTKFILNPHVDPLVPMRSRCDFKNHIIFNLDLRIGILISSFDGAMRCMPQYLTDVNISSGNGLVPSGNNSLT